MSATGLRPTGRPVPRDPTVAVWVVTGACWLLLVTLLLGPGVDLARHDAVIEGTGWGVPTRLAVFTGVWLVMIGAMMLPTTLPMVRMFVAVSNRQARPGPARIAFGAAYLVVWLGFALVALVGDVAVHQSVERWAWLHERNGLVLAATLLLAGGYQLSPLKDACLRACRTPLSVVAGRYRPGPAGGWRVGVAHALNCLGCCWALMLVMFATGVGSLLWMLGLTGVMVVEKTLPGGDRLVRPVAVALLVAGAAMALPLLAG